MIFFNLAGLAIFVPCTMLGFFVLSCIEEVLLVQGLPDGVVYGVFLAILAFFCSISALLFDRSDVQGVLSSYRSLTEGFFNGRHTSTASRVAVVGAPLACYPPALFGFTVLLWGIEVFFPRFRFETSTYLMVLAASALATAASGAFAYMTRRVRLLPAVDQAQRGNPANRMRPVVSPPPDT